MKLVSEEQINHIRTSVDIVDIVAKYLPLTPKGKNYFGVCPFHDDTNPSMSVSQEKQIYTCFSCHATGNVFKFIMDYEHIGFGEALKMLADIAGIAIDTGEIKAQNKNTDLYKIYEASQKLYTNNINTEQGSKAIDYLKSRDINEEIIKEFEIGLALKTKDTLTKFLMKKDYNDKSLIDSGLIIKSASGYNDIFYNRIMFPLYDLFGKVVGYSGRIYENDHDSKYINTKETPIFKKGELLYNYHRAKEEARKTNTIIVMEGFMDVIRAYTIGLTNVVATMGTAVTKNQINLLRRLANNIVICFDGDSAGKKATMTLTNELLSLDITPKIVFLEDNNDPDEFIKKNGAAKFLDKVNNPLNVMDYKLLALKETKDLTKADQLAEYVNNVILELKKINDEVLRELTIQKLAKESNLDINFLKEKVGEVKIVKKDVVKTEKIKLDKYRIAEANLIYYMLKSKEVINIYDNQEIYLPDENYRFLAREITYFYKKNNYINVADLLTNLPNDLITLVGYIESLELSEFYKIDEINDYIAAIREFNIKSECERLTKKLNTETDEIKKAEIAQKIVDILVRGENNV